MSFIRNFLAAVLFFVSSIYLAGPVNINSTNLEALASLKGIGPVPAAAIIADREATGPFSSVEDLMCVKGIGKQIIEMNKDMIIISELGNPAQ